MDTQVEQKNQKKYNLNKNIKYSIETDEYGTRRNLLKMLQDHTSGLGELFKNSKDEYERENFNREDCLAILFFKNGTKDQQSLIGFLDFGGMDKKRLENFKEFNKTDASLGENTTEDQQYGGKGNGAKLYGLSLFDRSSWYTGKDKHLYRVGFNTKIVTLKQSKKVINKNLRTETEDLGHYTNVTKTIEPFLKKFNIKYVDLPVKVKKLLEKRKSFTFFIGENVKNYPNQIKVMQELKKIIQHHESIIPMEQMNIYVCAHGKIERENDGEKFYFLKPTKIIPHKEQFNNVLIDIPDTLLDEDTGNEIDMKNTSFKQLIIRSSQLDMPNSAIRSRHLIVGRKATGSLRQPVGFWKVRDLSSNNSGFSRHLYGEVYHDELDEYTSNNRTTFTSSPFINALQKFISLEIDKIADAHVEKQKEKVEKKQKENINNFQKNLEDIFMKGKFIKHKIPGSGNINPNGIGGTSRRNYKKRGKLDNMQLSIAHEYTGKGVVFRPRLLSFDSSGKSILNHPVTWEIEDKKIVSEHERQLNLLYSKNSGTTKFFAKSRDGLVSSNSVEITVLDIEKITINFKSKELKERTSGQVNYEVIDANDNVYNSCYLTYTTNNSSVVGTTPKGIISGRSVGTTELTAMTDDCISNTIKINITKNDKPPKDKGGGFPIVKKSGWDIDPTLGEGATDSFLMDKDYPPVYQRPIDIEKGIWWINFQSPFAKSVRERSNIKSKTDGEQSPEFRIYFLEQWFDIMARVNIRNNLEYTPENLNDSITAIDDEKVDFNKKIEPFIEGILKSDEFFSADGIKENNES
jgi:hypothetical protein